MPETYVLYADVLFLINFILDFLCLYTAGAVLAVKMKLYRIFIAAAAGGFYSLLAAYALSSPAFYVPAAHVAGAFLLCFIAYGTSSPKAFIGRTAVFILTAAFAGGALSAFFSLAGKYYSYNGGLYADISPGFLIGVAVFSVGAAYLYALVCRRKISHTTVCAEIEKDGETFQVTLLVDSGCFVVDPLTGKGVVVVSHAAFLGKTPSTPRVIPVKTAGGNALLYGFKPDKLTLAPLGGVGKTKDAVVAVDMENDAFSGCDGLISPALL